MPRTIFRLLVPPIVTATLLLAQEPLYTLKVDVPLVGLDVTVTDPYGKTVGNLSAKDFQVLENGVPQEIQFFSPISAPYNVALVFDRSGSTQHKWPLMQKAVAGFIANLRQQDRILIAAFDYELNPLLTWTDKREKALDVLAQLVRPKPVGGTAFYQAVDNVVRREFRDVAGRRAVVVLTDGRDTSFYNEILSRNRMPDASQDRGFQRTLRTVQERRIPVYFVAVNTDRNFEPNVTGGDEYRNLKVIFPNSPIADGYLTEVRKRMEAIAERSGGRVLFPRTFQDIVPLYQQIGRELGTSYSLGYISRNPESEGELRQIEVRTTDETLRLSQSRKSYYAGKMKG